MSIRLKDIVITTNKANVLTEENLRIQLAYLYRIFDYYGWCDLIVTHLSARIPNQDAFLMNPFGLAFSEITPENLVKISFDGKLIESPYDFYSNQNGAVAHTAIYNNKPEISCILHTHSHHGVVISSLDTGLLLLDQISMLLYNKIGYHEFDTLFVNDIKQRKFLEDMSTHNCMILHNHGLLTAGKSIQEAFWFHYHLEYACKIQVLAMSTGAKLKQASEHVIAETAARYDKWKDDKTDLVSDSELLFEAAKRKVGYPW